MYGTYMQEMENLLFLLYQSHPDEAHRKDVEAMVTILEDKKLQALVRIHSCITNNPIDRLVPEATSSAELVDSVLDMVSFKEDSREAHDLFLILQNPYFQAFISAHDQVANRDYFPKLPEVPEAVDEDEETVKIVQLVKSNEPLGATIKIDVESGTIIIARILHGGAADRSGLIQVGDEVHEVNGINVRGKTPADVLQILEQSIDGTVTFKLIPSDGRILMRESKVRVRAHFDYNPKDDPEIPCRDAGLAFQKGDVLHIVNQDDRNWWQARKEGDRNMRAGLIPGRLLQERRILSQRNVDISDEEDDVVPTCRSPGSVSKKNRKTKKIMYEAKENDDYDREEIATYEEVARLYPRIGIYRPVLLLGPPGVGRNELKRRLLAVHPDHFRTTIPHTSRPPKPNEINGKDYYFLTREEMEEEIRLGHFVEHGEYKGNLYGTSIESVYSIVNGGYVCVMNPHPQALKMLRTAELKPYVIFIKPPPYQKFKETRQDTHARSTFDEHCSRGFTDDEFNDIIHSAKKIEFLYGHWFDAVIVNENLSEAFKQLLTVIQNIETQPQWVPGNWVN